MPQTVLCYALFVGQTPYPESALCVCVCFGGCWFWKAVGPFFSARPANERAPEVGAVVRKTQQHPQGFPRSLGFMPHIVYPLLWAQISPSPCANPAPMASEEEQLKPVLFSKSREGLSQCKSDLGSEGGKCGRRLSTSTYLTSPGSSVPGRSRSRRGCP